LIAIRINEKKTYVSYLNETLTLYNFIDTLELTIAL